MFSSCLILVSWVFQNMAYYKLSHVDARIANPEQRIASDVPKFCSELSDIIQEDLIAVTDGLLYTWRLCSYASPKYVLWILVIVFMLNLLVYYIFLNPISFSYFFSLVLLKCECCFLKHLKAVSRG